MLRTGLLMKTVDVLGDQSAHDPSGFQCHQVMMCLIRARAMNSRPAQNRSCPIALSLGSLLYELLMLDRLAAKPAAMMIAIGGYS